MCHRVTHGHTYRGRYHPLYKTWRGMRDRCLNKRCRAYKNYGGRGITICKRWDSFQSFIDDMGLRPPGTSIDRIDNNKGYSPDNCRWATPKQQNCNSRNARLLTVGNKTMTITEWGKRIGVSQQAISQRLRLGWSPIDAVSVPGRAVVHKLPKKTIAAIVKLSEQGKTNREVASILGVSKSAVQRHYRLSRHNLGHGSLKKTTHTKKVLNFYKERTR